MTPFTFFSIVTPVAVAVAPAPASSGIHVSLPVQVEADGGAAVDLYLPHGSWQALRWAAIRADVAQWEKLPPNWDGRGGAAPSPQVVSNVLHVLDGLQHRGAVAPRAYVAGDGEIELKWRAADGSNISASLLEDGHIVALALAPGEDSLRIDEPFEAAQLGPLFDRVERLA